MNTIESNGPISTFSLNDLVVMAGGNAPQGLRGECLAVDTHADLSELQYPCRIDAVIIGVLTAGELVVSCNLQECRLVQNTMFIFPANVILQEVSMHEAYAHIAVISSEFIQNCNIDLRNLIPTLMHNEIKPCLLLDEPEAQLFRNYISLVEQEVRIPEQPFSRDVVRGLLTSLIYKAMNLFLLHSDPSNVENGDNNDRSTIYFRRFIDLLSQHYRSERSVGFYARRLCITPKYLTTLIKRVSGRSVSEWIDHYVILEAKTLLKYSHMSVQEIAYYLNFSNQSFFGSYFKRITGLSPTQYKEKE